MPEGNKVNYQSVFGDEDYFSYKKRIKRQRLMVGALSIVSFVILALGVYKISAMLAPGELPESWGVRGEKATDDQSLGLAFQDDAVLRKQDTDGDGLSDFDELKIYDTSPYLADSDSDGVSDFEEVQMNSDPTCGSGDSCFVVTDATSAGNAATGVELVPKQVAGTLTIGGAQVTPEKLRDILIQSGTVTAEEAALIDDDTLLAVFQKMLEANPELLKTVGTGTVSQPVIGADGQSVEQAVEKAKSLSTAEIRKMLIDSGVEKAAVDVLDDATLLKLYQETLADVSSGYKNK